jgi:hypothetical protein
VEQEKIISRLLKRDGWLLSAISGRRGDGQDAQVLRSTRMCGNDHLYIQITRIDL